jgi:hypothetical protein
MNAAGPQNIQPVDQPTLHDMILADAMAQAQQSQMRVPGTFTAQMMDKLFSCKLPQKKEEYDEYYRMLPTLMAALPRIPNINKEVYTRFIRWFKDIQAMSASEGMARVVQSEVIEMIYELRLSAARGDIPLPGLTAVSSIISSRTTAEQKITMPQQPDSGGIFGFGKKKG